MILRSCTFRTRQRFELYEELWLPCKLKEKNLKKKKIFLSQTVRAKALIHGMYLMHLMTLYQNNSNYCPGSKIGPRLWGLGFHVDIKMEIFKNLLVLNRKG